MQASRLFGSSLRKRFALVGLLLIGACALMGINLARAQQTCTPGWVVIESPNPDTSNNQLKGATVISSTDAWAVGLYVNRAANQFQNLAMHWDGARWTITPTPNPHPGSDQLKKVAAVSSTDVWAVVGH